MAKRGLLLAGLALAALASQTSLGAADYAREQKWADEILPGIVYGEPVYLELRQRRFLALFTEVGVDAKPKRSALILVHGLGVHPDWGLIGMLRGQLSERGYTTLSIQMPILAVDAKAEQYPATFPEASARLGKAVEFLKSKGYTRYAVVSHSMGSRMTHHYLTRVRHPEISAWVAIGMPAPFDSSGKLNLPILDLYGADDFAQVLETADQRARVLRKIAGARQRKVPYTDHFFTGKDAELVDAIQEFLKPLL